MENLTQDMEQDIQAQDVQKGSSLKSFINRVNEDRARIKQETSDYQQNERIKSFQNQLSNGLNVNSKEAEEQSFINSRADVLAGMIVDYAKDHGKVVTGSSADIIRDYLIGNKKKRPNAGKDFAEFTHSTWDEEDFANHMGWTGEKSVIDDFTDFLGRALSNATWPERTAAEGVSDFINSFRTGNPQRDAAIMKERAINDYAYDKYGGLDGISEEDYQKVQRDIDHDPSILEEYMKKYTPLNSAIEMGVGGLGTVASLTPWGMLINGLISVGMEAPYARDLLGMFGTALDLGGGLITSPLKYIDTTGEFENLPEETKSILNQGISGLILHKALFGENKITGKTEIRPWLRKTLKSITPDFVRKLYNKITSKGTKTETMQDIENDYKIIRAKEKIAGKIADLTKDDFEKVYESISNTLDRIPPEKLRNINTYDELITQVDYLTDRIQKLEDDIYKLDERTYGPENDILEEGGATFYPIKEGIDLLRKIYADDRVTLAAIDRIEMMYYAHKITNGLKNKMARAIAAGYEAYNKQGEVKESITAGKVKEVRDALKSSARGAFDNLVPGLKNSLEYLDGVWHDALMARSRFKTAKGKFMEEENDIPLTSKGEKIADKAINMGAEAFAAYTTKGLSLANKLKKKIGREKYDPMYREGQLNQLLKLFSAKKNKLGGTDYEAKIEEYLDKVASYEEPKNTNTTTNAGEGEVIEPKKKSYYDNKYLEDIVEIIDKIDESPKGLEYYMDALDTLDDTLEGMGVSKNEIASARDQMILADKKLISKADYERLKRQVKKNEETRKKARKEQKEKIKEQKGEGLF